MKIQNQTNSTYSPGMPVKGIRGQILSFHDDPFLKEPHECYDYIDDGITVI